ncbi:MAG: hypothetical protein LBQ37_03840 [Elusimicrobiota bacterium]|nr:hypothetical protein [Elusimicrobiota bacterium]
MYKKNNEDLRDIALEKAITVIKNAVPSIEQDIKDSNKVNLIIDINDLSKNDNLYSVFILDNQLNLIATSSVEDSLDIDNRRHLYNNAFLGKTNTIQLITTNKDIENETKTKSILSNIFDKETAVFLYSTPIDTSHILFAEISLNNILNLTKRWRDLYYFPGAAAIALVLSIILYFLSRLIISIPYNSLRKSYDRIKSEIRRQERTIREKDSELDRVLKEAQDNKITAQEKLPEQAQSKKSQYDDFEQKLPDIVKNQEGLAAQKENAIDDELDLFLKENNRKAQLINSLEESKKSLTEMLKYCANNFAKNADVYIILNSSDNIVFAADKTNKILKDKFLAESPITDAILRDDIINYISNAKEEPNVKIKCFIGDIEISFYALYLKGQYVGTIISSGEINV